MPSPEDGWFIATMGGVLLLTAKWLGHEVSSKLADPGESPERTAAYCRWNTWVGRVAGAALLAYGGWLMAY